jgi:quercetin dioxygenase-like cupin family protein
MNKYTVLNLKEIPIEQAHGGTGSKQMLIQPHYLTTPHLEAITKGYLPTGNMFDWHNHKDIDEIFIVTQGEGKFYYRQDNREDVFNYSLQDVIIAPANLFHKIIAEGKEETQGFFFRINARPNTTHTLHFIQRNINSIPFESIHNVPNTRQTLVTTDMVATDYLEAITKGTLRPSDHWENHKHNNTDEIAIVLQGQGKWIIEDEEIPYQEGNVVIVQGNTPHMQIATGNIPTEFYFIRVQA